MNTLTTTQVLLCIVKPMNAPGVIWLYSRGVTFPLNVGTALANVHPGALAKMEVQFPAAPINPPTFKTKTIEVCSMSNVYVFGLGLRSVDRRHGDWAA